jgi:hypothetical protein
VEKMTNDGSTVLVTSTAIVIDSDNDNNNDDEDDEDDYDDDLFARFASTYGISQRGQSKNGKYSMKDKSNQQRNKKSSKVTLTINLKSKTSNSAPVNKRSSISPRSQRSPKRSGPVSVISDKLTTEHNNPDNNNSQQQFVESIVGSEELMPPSQIVNDDVGDDESINNRDSYYDDEDDYYNFDQNSSLVAEIEDCYKFLEETHEEQDPQWIMHQNNNGRKLILYYKNKCLKSGHRLS